MQAGAARAARGALLQSQCASRSLYVSIVRPLTSLSCARPNITVNRAVVVTRGPAKTLQRLYSLVVNEVFLPQVGLKEPLEMPITPESPTLTVTERAGEKQHAEPENISMDQYPRNSSMDATGSTFKPSNFENNKIDDTIDDNMSTEHQFFLELEDVVPPLPKIKRYRASIDLPLASILSKKLAAAVIMHASENKIINESDLACVDCHHFPVLPVTGTCGHTRCTNCITENGVCPCGVLPPKSLHVNTLVREVIEKLLEKMSTNTGSIKCSEVIPETRSSLSGNSRRKSRRARNRHDSCPYSRSLMVAPDKLEYEQDVSRPVPVSFQRHLNTARWLIISKQYYEAVPLLAHVASSTEDIADDARVLLDRVIAGLSITANQQRLTRHLFKLVQQNSANTWLQPADLECSLCCNPFSKPVTTPCGHNYCHICLERSLDYWKKCPLCKTSLIDFNIFSVKETVAVTAALRSINAIPPPVHLRPDEIRLLVCTIAYPGVACPLYLLEPGCSLLVRRVLASDRRFGILPKRKDNSSTTAIIGTILEIRDCVYFENGQSIITTVGVSRFKLLERDYKDGCDVARYEPFVDIYHDWEGEPFVRLELAADLAVEVSAKALDWIKRLDDSLLVQIENTFGKQPDFCRLASNTWAKENGPMWLWWVICILPLQDEFKIMLLSSEDLVKRLLTVSFMLDALKRDTLTTPYISNAISRVAFNWLSH